jgi:signal transduction histidine kinase
MLAVWSSAAIILFTGWRRTTAPDAFEAPFMAPVALAASGPLSLYPLIGLSSLSGAMVGILAGLVALPLGWLMASGIVDTRVRRIARQLSLGAVVVAVLIGAPLSYQGWPDGWNFAHWLAASAVVVLPALLLAGATLRGQPGFRVAAARRLLGSLAVLSIGVTPAVTGLCLLVVEWHVLVLPAIAVAVTLIVLTRFALQPLAGLAGQAQTQRDRVVAAAEAERIRLASVLHDGPLADITLLIQRLDDRGDADSAAVARAIAHELRAIGSELRLPILDDLGTGPALDWLVTRLAGRSGVPIMFEHQTLVRPPAPVELAMYRVAQEAIVNALKHGLPPIEVRYRATAEGAELWVDDHGAGIAADAPAKAEHEGRLGLASMSQRAETTGARLMVGRRPEGGTRVSLTWQSPVPMPGLADARPVQPLTAGAAQGHP